MVDSAPSRPKRFWPTYRVWRKRSKASAAFSRSRMWRCSTGSSVVGTPSVCCWIHRFCSGSWMCMYSMPRVRQYASRRMSSASPNVSVSAPRQPVDHELAVEVPQREAVGGGVELGVQGPRLGRQRVEIGDQMATHAVHVDQALHVDLLHQPLVLAVAGVDVGLPAHGLVRHVHRREHRLVEAVLARQALGDVGEEQPGLGALDDAVVVGRREGDDGSDADLRQAAAVGGLELGRVPERPTPMMAPWPGMSRGTDCTVPERARVGERDRGPGEVVGAWPCPCGPCARGPRRRSRTPEVEALGCADHGDQQRPGAVGLLEVDRQTQADVVVVDHARLARSPRRRARSWS